MSFVNWSGPVRIQIVDSEQACGEFTRRGRRDAPARTDALRARLPAVGTIRIVRWIRKERETN